MQHGGVDHRAFQADARGRRDCIHIFFIHHDFHQALALPQQYGFAIHQGQRIALGHQELSTSQCHIEEATACDRHLFHVGGSNDLGWLRLALATRKSNLHRIEAFAYLFHQQIKLTHIVNNVGVIAFATHHGVHTLATVDHVVCSVARQDVVSGIARQVQLQIAGLACVQVLQVRAQGQGGGLGSAVQAVNQLLIIQA